MEKISTLGIDLAKNSFQVCGTNKSGKIIFNKKLSRTQLLNFVSTLEVAPDFLIAMEACGSSNYWGQEFKKLGFECKMMAPQFVKPYVKTNKNDARDAEAIAEAVRRPEMRFVPIKTVEQQELKLLHTVREQFIKRKTALSNEIRAILYEFGITINQSHKNLKDYLGLKLREENNKLGTITKELLEVLHIDFLEIEKKVDQLDKKLNALFKVNVQCQKLGKVRGVGVVTATAIVATVGDIRLFKNARSFAAYLGLTPRQSSTGGKQKLLGISKRGDSYIRKNLVHGARSVLIHSKDSDGKLDLWIKNLVAKKGYNKAAVALANKNARIIWAILTRNEDYNPQYCG